MNTGAETTITASADLLGVSDMTYDPANKLIYGSAGYINQGTLPNGTVIFKYNTNTGEFTSLDTLQSTTGLGFATSSVPGSNGALFIGSGLGAVFKLELTPTPSLTLAASIAPVRDVDVLPNGNLLIQSGQNLLLTNQTGTVLDTCYKFVSNTTFTGYVSVKSNDELFFSGALNPASIYKLTVIEPGVSNRVPVTIIVNPSPLVDSIANMQVCPGSTVAAINFTTPITGGTVGYKWANNNTAIGLAASGFGNIPSFTAAATAQTSTISVRPYMLKSATDTCFGTVRTFNIAADLPAAPTTTGNLVVYTGTKTISQLAVIPLAGGSLNYFYQATGGTALAGSTIVVDDTTYYVTQTVAGCESNPRKQIKVNRIAADSNVLCSPATVGSLIATPTTGSSAKWYDVPSGGTVLANTAALGVGQDTLYVEEGNPSAQLSLHSYSPTDLSYAINGLTVGENDTIYYGTFGDNAKIIRINPDGSNPTIITSGGPGENIRYVQYESDASGRYILYTTQNTVKRLNLNTGVITTIWTSPVSSIFNLREFSRDVANNKLYVADTEFGRIKLVDLANNTAVTIDSLPYKQFGGSSFPRRPFAVCYVAPNSLYIGDFTNGLVFKKDLTTGIRTDSISYPSITDIRLLSNGKIMLAGGDKVSTINQDLTGRTDIVTSLISGGYAEFNSQGELVFKDYRTIKKISTIQSNRVPVTVIVNPKPIVTATIDKVVCNNSTVAAVNFSTTTIGGTVTYAWTNNKTSIGLAASGTGNIASFTAVNNSNGLDTAMVIVTPTITNAGVSCAGTKDTFLIIVNPTAVVNAVSDKVVCNGSAVTAINFGTTNTGGTVTYAWANNTTSIGLAASGTGNIATFNGVNTGTAPVTATIVVTPTFTNGGVSCEGPTKTFTITVNPTVTVNPENDQVVCNGAGSTAINFSTTATGGTTTYTWTNNKPTNGLAASGTGNIASFTAVNNGTAPDTATIIVTPTFANGGTNCVGTKDTIYVVVNPTAKINAIADKVECNGSVVVATMPTSTATGGTVTYTWTNNTTSIGLAASGTGNIPSFTATNTGSTTITSTIIVTPTFTNGGVSCVGTNDTFNITINPPPIFAATTDKYVCNASTTTAVVFTTALTGGTAVYNWTNSNTAIGLAATGTGNVPSFTATNNTTAPIMGSIVVYMDYTNAGLTCTSLKDTFNYVVNPTAVVNPINDQVLCNGSTTAAISFSTTATGGTLTYNWTNNNTSFGLAASGTGNIASFNAINSSNAPITATITVTPTFTNGGVSCTGTAQSFTVTVNPTAVVNAVSNQIVCDGSSNTAVTFSSPVAGTTYSWTNSNPSIGLAASGTGNVPSFVAVNPNTNAVTATITVTPNTPAGCIGQSITYTITVNGLSVAPTAINNPTPIVCANNAFTTLSVNGGALGSGAVWKWYADSLNTVSIGSGATLSNIPVAKTTTYFVRAEGTCNNTAAASVVVQRANLVSHVRQHWSDVLLFDNSSKNFVAWQWYKNGVAVSGASLQQYSESSALVGTYYVVATDKNGEKTITCPLTITAGSFTGLKISLFPNPADKGANVKVATSFTISELQGATITVSDIYGRVIRQITNVSPNTTIQAPAATGMYVVTLTLQNGVKYSANLLTN